MITIYSWSQLIVHDLIEQSLTNSRLDHLGSSPKHRTELPFFYRKKTHNNPLTHLLVISGTVHNFNGSIKFMKIAFNRLPEDVT